MFPIILRFGEFAIHTYGVMLALAFFIGIYLAERRAVAAGIDKKIVSDLGFWILISAVIGARLLYVLLHPKEFQHNPLEIIAIWRGGLMFFGGFILALILGIYFAKKNQIKVLTLGDIVSPSIALGIFFTRIGCFFNGCCFGIPTDLPIGVKFPKDCAAGYSPVGDNLLLPTQLISSLFGLLLFFYLEKRRKKAHHGELFGTILLGYGTFRFLIDIVRYYENSANYLTNQIFAAGVAFIGLIILLKSFATKSG